MGPSSKLGGLHRLNNCSDIMSLIFRPDANIGKHKAFFFYTRAHHYSHVNRNIGINIEVIHLYSMLEHTGLLIIFQNDLCYV